MKRLGVCFFYDKDGIVDDYMLYLLREIGNFCEKIIFVVNGDLQASSSHAVAECGCEILLRENSGFDVGAYKAALEHVGYNALPNYDEVILFNHTFYGPLFPLSELFTTMDAQVLDFWGITSHKEMIPNPFTGTGRLPRHINSHFIAVRNRLLSSEEFVRYWRDMPLIKSYTDSIFQHESKFTEYFNSLGFIFGVYADDINYDSHYPSFINVDQTIENRCPIIKRRAFFHDHSFHEEYGIDLPRALRLIRDNTSYDLGLIWKNILRSSELRTLNTNAALMSIFPDVRVQDVDRRYGRIAVCAHINYTDMTDDLLTLAEHIPCAFDFIATTDTEAKAAEIRRVLSGSPRIENIIVRVLEVNRGRDMSALFIACRDLFLDDRYDLVCRMHSKKSPQVDSSRSLLFKRHMEENLLQSEGYVTNILDMFANNPWVGLAVPPIVHISYPTLGNAWFVNRERAKEVAEAVGLRVKFDSDTPVAAYGTMFWFRPLALRKLFAHKWAWDDFNEEPHHVDGGLAHVLERLIAYAAQDAGYLTQHVMSSVQAERNYVSLEYKLQKLASFLGGDFKWQHEFLRKWKESGFPLGQQYQAAERSGDSWKIGWWKNSPLLEESVPLSSTAHRVEPVRTVGYAPPVDQGRKFVNFWKITRKRGSEFLANLEDDAEIITDFLVSASGGHALGGGRPSIKRETYRYLLSDSPIEKELLFLFDSNYYLSRNPDVASKGVNPLVHFIRWGAYEGRNPHPLFDVSYYLKRYPDVAKAGINPLLHFVRHGGLELRETHPLFDAEYYHERYPEVVAASLSPLHHYVLYGGRERRDPHPLFNTEYYLQCRRQRGHSDCVLPLVDYIQFGANECIDPHPLFDGRFYKALYGEVMNSGNPLTDFIESGAAKLRYPHPLFKTDFYVAQHPDLQPDLENPLFHYLDNARARASRPHPLFDGAFYLDRYREVSALRLNPLVHFVRWGAGELRDPNPDFNSQLEQKKRRTLGNPFVDLVHEEYTGKYSVS